VRLSRGGTLGGRGSAARVRKFHSLLRILASFHGHRNANISYTKVYTSGTGTFARVCDHSPFKKDAEMQMSGLPYGERVLLCEREGPGFSICLVFFWGMCCAFGSGEPMCAFGSENTSVVTSHSVLTRVSSIPFIAKPKTRRRRCSVPAPSADTAALCALRATHAR
jgi:hypothetical protein